MGIAKKDTRRHLNKAHCDRVGCHGVWTADATIEFLLRLGKTLLGFQVCPGCKGSKKLDGSECNACCDSKNARIPRIIRDTKMLCVKCAGKSSWIKNVFSSCGACNKTGLVD